MSRHSHLNRTAALSSRATEAAPEGGHELNERPGPGELVLPLDETERSRLSVLYVSETFDAPYRYRCVHACEQLRSSGVVANVSRLDEPSLLEQVRQYSVVVLFRLRYSDRVAEVAQAARAAGARVGFDIDDLIFDPQFEELMPFLAAMPRPKIAEYRASFVAFGRTLALADFCIGSTEQIAAHASRLGKAAFTHPNLLSTEYMRLSALIYPLRKSLLRPGTIGYMSGSNTHDRDLATVAPALAEVMRRHEHVRLLLCGPVLPPDELRFAADRVARVPYQDFRVYPWLMARCSAILAPLAQVNDFTNAKSSLKVFEAGVFGVPVIASPSAPYLAAVDQGRSGFIARSASEWEEALSLLADRDRSLEIGAAARRLALARYSQPAHRDRLARLLLANAGTATRGGASSQALATDSRSRLRQAASITRHSVQFALSSQLPTPPFPPRTPLLERESPEVARLAGRWIRDASRPGGEVCEAGLPVGRGLLQGGLLPLESPCVHQIAACRTAEGPRLRATGADPYVVFPQSPPTRAGTRWLYVRMASATEATAQFFWRREGEHFGEDRSVQFTVGQEPGLVDYLFDLGEAQNWRQDGGVVEFRFDPTDATEPFELEHVAVLERIPPVTRAVDIVVPIYNARDFNLRCIESVRRHATGDWRLIAVNDASTDARVQGDLEQLAREDERIVVLLNEQNRGFVGTANRGMVAARPEADVLLLNSDTEVFEGFLERLRAATHSTPRTGIVTPFSNNATLCSIPEFGKDNPIPEGHTPESFSAAVTLASELLRPELVTGVGFCMYLRREVLDAVGLLDEETFGRGFGEENDLCQRARKRGWDVRLADDVFVWHKGKASFGTEGHELDRKNARLLEEKHPGYHAEVARFFERNPLEPLHRRVRLAIPRTRPDAATCTLFLVHASPFSPTAGGTEFHVKDLLRALKLPRALVGYPEGDRLTFAEIVDGEVDRPEFFTVTLAKATGRFGLTSTEVEAALDEVIRLFGVGGAHLHHLMYWPVASVHRALVTRGVPFVYTVHDYLAVCPSWNLINLRSGTSCRCTGDARQCMTDLFAHLGEAGPADPVAFRDQHARAFRLLLEDARAIVAPSDAAARNVVQRYQTLGARVEVIAHGYDGEGAVARRAPGGVRRVAVAGAIAHRIKGADAYIELVRRTGDLELEWHFFGPTTVGDFEARVRAAASDERRVRFHGPYARHQLPRLLAEQEIDLAVQLPIWDETFSYVLSESWLAGVPVLATAKGAIGDRVRESGAGWVVNDVADAQAVLRRLTSNPGEVAAAAERAAAVGVVSMAANAERYRALYSRAEVVPSRPPSTPIERGALAALERLHSSRPRDETRAEDGLRPRYQGMAWYPLFLKIKHLIPARARAAGRAWLTREKPLAAFGPRELAEAPHEGLDDARVGEHGFQARAVTDDPQLLLHLDVEPSRVRGIRVRLRAEGARHGVAQLFWAHGDQPFSEEKSVRLEFAQPDVDWIDWWVPLESGSQPGWFDGDRVRRLRLDPVNVRGATFAVEKIELLAG